MTTRIKAIGFQQLPLVGRADRLLLDEKRARPPGQISQRALQESIQSERLRLADGGSQCAGENRCRGSEVKAGIGSGLIPAGRVFQASQCFTWGIVGLLLCRAF